MGDLLGSPRVAPLFCFLLIFWFFLFEVRPGAGLGLVTSSCSNFVQISFDFSVIFVLSLARSRVGTGDLLV